MTEPTQNLSDPALISELRRDSDADEATARAGLAAFAADAAQDERTSRDAQDRADARVRDTVGALDRQTAALKLAPRADEGAFIDLLLIELVSQPLDVAAMRDRVGTALVVRAMLARAPDPLPAVPAPPLPPKSPPDLSALPGTLTVAQAVRYLAQFAAEFAGTWVITPDDAAKHWAKHGRAEIIAGKRAVFVP